MTHSVDVVRYAATQPKGTAHVEATVYAKDLEEQAFTTRTETLNFWIKPRNLGPINTSFIRRLVFMRLSFALISYGPTGNLCLVWNVSVNYDFRNRGQIELSLSSRVNYSCGQGLTYKDVWAHGYWLNFAILLTATCNFVLSSRSIVKSIAILWRLRSRYAADVHNNSDEEQEGDEYQYEPLLNTHVEVLPSASSGRAVNERRLESHLTLHGAARLFNKWFFVMLIASLCNIVSALLFLTNGMKHAPTTPFHKICTGLGCAMLWISLVTYASGSFHYYTLVHTLTRALPRVLRFVVGVFPVYIGYALFGMLYFGDQSDRFADISRSLITLFALLNGDEIRSTFMDLNQPYPVVSAIYLYSFVCLFIYVVLNVFIAIVEESFFASRAKTRSLEQFTKEMARRERDDTTNIAVMESMIQELDDPLTATPGSPMTRGEESDGMSFGTTDSNAARRSMYDFDDNGIDGSVSRALRRRLEISKALRSLD